jgi:N-acetylneuraminic acid mutarotase
VLVIGGENQEGSVKSVFLICDMDGVLKIFPQPDLPMAVTAGASALVGKTVYLIGGSTGAHETTGCLSLDTETPGAGWKRLADLPVPLSHAVVVARDDGSGKCIYALGGRHRIENKTIFSGTVWKYRIKHDSWMEDAVIQDDAGGVVLAAGTGIAAGKHSIVLFGGDHGAIFSLTEQLNQQIGEAADSSVRAALTSRKDSILTNHPGFPNRILVYNVRTRKWSAGGEMPRPAPVTTHACQWNGRVFIPSGEIRPGVRTPQVLCTKIKTE